MKIFISSDIEGTNGIADWNETSKSTPAEYDYFTKKMTAEVGAVCNGINSLDANAEIFVKDAHGTGRNINHEELPHNVVLNRAFSRHPHSMMNLIDKTFDASILTGYHSPSYTNGNPLAHTMTSAFSRVLINGKIASEFLINYYTSLYYGVPMVMVSGDARLMELVNETDSDIITVASLCGFGTSVTSPHPKKTRLLLNESAKTAVTNASRLKSLTASKLPKHFETEIRFREHPRAFHASYYPGAKKLDDHTVGFECSDYFDFLRFFEFV